MSHVQESVNSKVLLANTGAYDDGMNSLTRYYLNNFKDGEKQDAYDLWTGHTTPESVQQVLRLEGPVKGNYH